MMKINKTNITRCVLGFIALVMILYVIKGCIINGHIDENFDTQAAEMKLRVENAIIPVKEVYNERTSLNELFLHSQDVNETSASYVKSKYEEFSALSSSVDVALADLQDVADLKNLQQRLGLRDMYDYGDQEFSNDALVHEWNAAVDAWIAKRDLSLEQCESLSAICAELPEWYRSLHEERSEQYLLNLQTACENLYNIAQVAKYYNDEGSALYTECESLKEEMVSKDALDAARGIEECKLELREAHNRIMEALWTYERDDYFSLCQLRDSEVAEEAQLVSFVPSMSGMFRQLDEQPFAFAAQPVTFAFWNGQEYCYRSVLRSSDIEAAKGTYCLKLHHVNLHNDQPVLGATHPIVNVTVELDEGLQNSAQQLIEEIAGQASSIEVKSRELSSLKVPTKLEYTAPPPPPPPYPTRNQLDMVIRSTADYQETMTQSVIEAWLIAKTNEGGCGFAAEAIERIEDKERPGVLCYVVKDSSIKTSREPGVLRIELLPQDFDAKNIDALFSPLLQVGKKSEPSELLITALQPSASMLSQLTRQVGASESRAAAINDQVRVEVAYDAIIALNPQPVVSSLDMKLLDCTKSVSVQEGSSEHEGLLVKKDYFHSPVSLQSDNRIDFSPSSGKKILHSVTFASYHKRLSKGYTNSLPLETRIIDRFDEAMLSKITSKKDLAALKDFREIVSPSDGSIRQYGNYPLSYPIHLWFGCALRSGQEGEYARMLRHYFVRKTFDDDPDGAQKIVEKNGYASIHILPFRDGQMPDWMRKFIENIFRNLNITTLPGDMQAQKIGTVYFAFAEKSVLRESDSSLDNLANTKRVIGDLVPEILAVAQKRKVRILLVGHTDLVGSYEANQKLSMDRALAAINELFAEHSELMSHPNIECVPSGRAFLQPPFRMELPPARHSSYFSDYVKRAAAFRRVEIFLIWSENT